MSALPISSSDNALATTAATEIGQIMTDGATVGSSTVIPAVPGFTSNADVVAAFKASAAGIIRQVTSGNGQAAVIRVVKGSPQAQAINGTFGIPLVVQVLDSANKPISGLSVSFGTPGAGQPSASLAGPAATDINGETQVIATANNYVGTYSVTASVTGVVVGIEFVLTNTNPKIYYANAHASSAQAIAGGGTTYTIVNFDTVSKDIGSGISTGSDWKYIPPAGQPQDGNPGIYHIETLVAVTSPTSGDIAELSLWKYNFFGLPADQLEVILTSVRTPPVGGASGSYLHGSAYIELSATDSFRIKVRCTNAAAQALVNTTGLNWIRILKVADPAI